MTFFLVNVYYVIDHRRWSMGGWVGMWQGNVLLFWFFTVWMSLIYPIRKTIDDLRLGRLSFKRILVLPLLSIPISYGFSLAAFCACIASWILGIIPYDSSSGLEGMGFAVMIFIFGGLIWAVVNGLVALVVLVMLKIFYRVGCNESLIFKIVCGFLLTVSLSLVAAIALAST